MVAKGILIVYNVMYTKNKSVRSIMERGAICWILNYKVTDPLGNWCMRN